MSGAGRLDLLVIGGGVGGLVTASVAGQLGLRVALVERGDNLGGDCLHFGCVPSKTLIRSAAVAHAARSGAAFGIPSSLGSVDLGAVSDRIQEVIATIQKHDDPERFRGYGIDVRFGEARFVDPHTVEVAGERLSARRFVIATGSRPAVPPIAGLDQLPFWTNETVFNQRELPGRLGVIGGGPIGLELAQAFQRLGSQVTVLEAAPRILAREDAELTDLLEARLRLEGLEVRTGARISEARSAGEALALDVADGDNVETRSFDALLVATGRHANVEALNLEAAGVRTAKGLIAVDRRMRTSQRHIFACGDCTGPYPFTHAAEYQAGVVIANVVFRLPKRANYRVIPWVTYTAPELAHVGLTEATAAEQGIGVKVLRFRFSDVDRALTDGETDGMMKLIVRRGRILGASILGPHAGELIHEVVLAMQAGVKLSALSGAVHAYPTLAQVHRRTANTLYAESLYSARTKTLVRWLQRLIP
ncbi:mercuric reductase [Methylonatrum kenyense]|uniref:dihydrolipoyl dehydrogenase family protein n=1 Tax=Methylonatrum kenyense TaxID=455253 RepID=UPI0020BF051C|nr:mercuric reductase [Methylonatrum kenyense]MCK8514799.1 mercuric reductase [Methylonatrum kenyense]